MLPFSLAGSKFGPAAVCLDPDSARLMQEILIIRFSSLGDLCLLCASLARLSAAPDAGNRRITLVTKPAFAPLMETAAGVDQVIALPGSDLRSLRELAGSLRSRRWHRIIDAHNTLRSRLLLALMGRRPNATLTKDTLSRLAFLKFGRRTAKLDLTMSQRFDRLFAGFDDSGHTRPDQHLPAFGTGRSPVEPILGLAPGAQWGAKQWPEASFAELLTMFRARSDAPVRVFLGPREERWFSGSVLEKTINRCDRIEIFRARSLTEVAALLSGCSRLVTNDSGLLHLAEATGTPVLAFFGPTVQEFGFFPRLHESAVLEVPLECRPCSRNGKRPCHRGDLACLKRITPAEALQSLLAAPVWEGSLTAQNPDPSPIPGEDQ
jgi:ADP-heptose:LPS heptosyltransferase